MSNSPESGGILNLPAVVLVALCALLLIRGTSESAKVNATMVVIKLAVLVLFIVIGVTGWNSANFTPFAPGGFSGVMTAAGVIFFSFIGLDAVSTAGEEVKNPRRNMPLAIIIALVVVTGMYVAVALVAVGAQPAPEFEDQEAGLAAILQNITGSTWPGTVVAIGAVISIFSITLVVLYGQTRILFAMGRDGMLPPFFHRVNPRTLTPVNNTVLVAVVVGLLAGLLPISFLAEMTSIGTLVAFLVVSIGVMVLRRTAPDLPRGFKVPGYPVTPILSIIGCLWIIKDLRPVTIGRVPGLGGDRAGVLLRLRDPALEAGCPRDRRPGRAVSERSERTDHTARARSADRAKRGSAISELASEPMSQRVRAASTERSEGGR